MYLIYNKVLEVRDIGTKIVGCQRQGQRPEILLSPNEVLTILDAEHGLRYLMNLAGSSNKDKLLFGRYQPIERGIQLSKNLVNLKEWSY